MNLLCGVIGVIFTLLYGNMQAAFLMMVAAAVFDFLDGLAARALGAYSDIGKELDSLCDLVSFGVLPSTMLTMSMLKLRGEADIFCFIPLLLAVFSAYRLAKFNLDERQHGSFLGLPTPACALLCSSLAAYMAASPESPLTFLGGTSWFLPVLSIALSALLVCEIPMFSFKFEKGKKADHFTILRRTTFLGIAAFVIAFVAVLRLDWHLSVMMIFAAYILLNLGFAPFGSKTANSSQPED